jgi:hypothetical protein
MRPRVRKKAGLIPYLVFAVCTAAWAGGPRFVTGTNYSGAAAGKMMVWYTPNLLYYTDPGNLNANVMHAQADAMVASAAASWNVAYARVTLAQGGVLGEHVSSQNTYFTGTSLVYPADVEATNYLSMPIAIVYDTDGSVTDLLLGSGASSLSACSHNAVTGSVDGFGQTGTIEHAVILLNGRCVGSTPQQMLQMQYQLERAFGRVLGLAWAQVNDNVFTAVNTVTANQMNNWPVMHPIDVICGTYTYQCMSNPFQLRPDDISSLALLYPVTAANIVVGKSLSVAAGSGFSIQASTYFPNRVNGMDSVNMTIEWGVVAGFFNAYQTLSAVSGATFQRNGGNPVSGMTVPASDNAGTPNASNAQIGAGSFGRMPYMSGFSNNMDGYVSAEAINPLYSGEYAVGIYEGTPISMTGVTQGPNGIFLPTLTSWTLTLFASSEPTSCSPGNDGVEAAPVAANATGWWTGLLCGEGHTSWFSATVKAGRTWTLEVTATDEYGEATVQKARPVIGVWNSTDATGTLPTIAASASAMNSMSLGMTQLPVAAASQAETVRIAIADQYGKGRPDFTYNARLLYADSIAPAVVGAGGGTITITGMGFRAGNQVTVNGVAANVVSWSANQIVAIAPTMAAAGMSVGAAADVAVTDPSTAGQTVMSGVLVYSGAPDTILVVSAPSFVETGVVSGTAFAVKVMASDGVTPVSGASVVFAVAGGAALTACAGTSSCMATTDANGVAQTTVSGTDVGSVTLKATEVSGGASVSVALVDADPVRVVAAASAAQYVAAGAAVSELDGGGGCDAG